MALRPKDYTEPCPLSRRRFFKTAALSLGTMILGPAFVYGQPKAKIVEESEPLAVALGYKKDAKKVDVKKYPNRASAEGKKQFCYNCMYFGKIDSGTGTCQLFQNNIVMANGWCNSWLAKPK